MKRADASATYCSPSGTAEQAGIAVRDVTVNARKGSSFTRGISDVITGEILRHESARGWYPLAAWCILLIFLYIGHVFDYQRLQRIEIAREMSLHEQRSRAMVFFSMKMNAVRHSNIMREIERRGIPLREGEHPPVVAEK